MGVQITLELSGSILINVADKHYCLMTATLLEATASHWRAVAEGTPPFVVDCSITSNLTQCFQPAQAECNYHVYSYPFNRVGEWHPNAEGLLR